jgi:hypothetical protein
MASETALQSTTLMHAANDAITMALLQQVSAGTAQLSQVQASTDSSVSGLVASLTAEASNARKAENSLQSQIVAQSATITSQSTLIAALSSKTSQAEADLSTIRVQMLELTLPVSCLEQLQRYPTSASGNYYIRE